MGATMCSTKVNLRTTGSDGDGLPLSVRVQVRLANYHLKTIMISQLRNCRHCLTFHLMEIEMGTSPRTEVLQHTVRL
jgi:AhpD family alkylhydroperoxidase